MRLFGFPFYRERRSRALAPVLDVIKFLTLMGVIFVLMMRGTERLGYNWQWYRVPRYLVSLQESGLVPGPLLEGLKVTLFITSISLVLAFAFGLVAAVFRLSNSFMARLVARGYLELIRNTPLLIQLFFIYFVLSPIVGLNRTVTAVLALSLFEGAYVSEIFRAGILSIDKGQWEAAYGSGLDSLSVYLHVILPQAVRRMLPPLTSQAVSLVKDSALVSTIAIYDLTMEGQVIISETFLTFEIWFTVAAMYLAVTLCLSVLVYVMERRFGGQYRVSW